MNCSRLFLFIGFVMNVYGLNAQDTIFFSNSKQMGVKVTEVGEEQIRYKRFDNQEGPTYTAQVNDIIKIKYKSGREDFFSHKEIEKADTSVTDQTPNRDKKFDINDEETTAYVEKLARFAGDKVLHNCAYNMDNSAVDVYYDQVFKDETSGEINIPIIVKWDRGSSNYWIKGTIKVTKEGRKTWSYTDNSGGVYSGCATTLKDL